MNLQGQSIIYTPLCMVGISATRQSNNEDGTQTDTFIESNGRR